MVNMTHTTQNTRPIKAAIYATDINAGWDDVITSTGVPSDGIPSV